VGHKKVPFLSVQQLWQIYIDSNNSFTSACRGKVQKSGNKSYASNLMPHDLVKFEYLDVDFELDNYSLY